MSEAEAEVEASSRRNAKERARESERTRAREEGELRRERARSWAEKLRQAQKRSEPFPESVHVQSDNTTKELRNATLGGLLCCLSAAGYFKENGHHHLRIGHTHEDVGAGLRADGVGLRSVAR